MSGLLRFVVELVSNSNSLRGSSPVLLSHSTACLKARPFENQIPRFARDDKIKHIPPTNNSELCTHPHYFFHSSIIFTKSLNR
jgi:hypothetical protein